MTGPTSDRHLPAGWIVPALTGENRAFFTSGRLLLQRCAACATVQHPPAELCRGCGSFDFDAVEARPAGTVVATTVVHHAASPLLAPAVPYNAAVVELDDHPGVRIAGNVVGVPPAEVRIGDAVTATWATVEPAEGEADEALRLPQWRPAEQAKEPRP